MARRSESPRAHRSPLRRTLRLVAPELRPQRAMICGGFLALMADVVFRVLEPWPMKYLLDSVLSRLGAAVDHSPATITVIIACGVAHLLVVAARALGNYLATVCFATVGARVAASLRARLFHHVQGLPQQFHARNHSADTVQRLVGDIARLQEVATTAGLPLLANVLTLLVMSVVMIVLSPGLALVVVACFVAFAVVSSCSSGRINMASRMTRRGEAELANTAQESLSSIRTVQAYGLESLVERRFGDASQSSVTQGVRAVGLAAGLERATDLIVGVATAGVLVWGGLRVMSGALTPGELVLFTSYLRTTMKPMRDLAKYTGRISRATASGERVADLMAITSEITDPSHPVVLDKVRGRIEFRGVTAAYEGVVVLDDIDLRIAPGEHVAIIGPSGSGKSTLVSLLVRAIDPVDGQVLLDGHRLDELGLAQLRSSVALLHQDTVLFADTVRENIRLGRLDASDEEVEAVARAANAHQFIVGWPNGYDTVVGERGSTVSGGQKQRLAIARALLRDSRVVVLDEVTTGLDPAASELVLDAIRPLIADRTLLAVTHDVAVAMRCSRVVWIDRGCILLDGPPARLLAESPTFRAWVQAYENSGGGGR